MAAWPENVNNKFYGLDGTPDDNRVQVKFKSGRTIYHKRNTIVKKLYSVKLRLDDKIKTNGKTEYERFLDWYENENGSGTAPVELTDLTAKTGIKTYFVVLENMNGQRYKELTLNLEEC